MSEPLKEFTCDEVVDLGERQVRVLGGNGWVMRDHRGRIAVRNVATNRLSYIPEWRLLMAARRMQEIKAVRP